MPEISRRTALKALGLATASAVAGGAVATAAFHLPVTTAFEGMSLLLYLVRTSSFLTNNQRVPRSRLQA